jgi:hypothetical protein
VSWNPPSTQTSFVPPRVVFGYRSELMRHLTPLILSVFAVAAPLLVLDALFGDGPMLFAAVFIGVLIWNTYWFAWRIGWSIEVDGDTVEWRTMLRTRTLRLDDLLGNDTFHGWQRLHARGGYSPIMMTPDRGWITFLERLNACRSDRPFRPTRLSRFGERWPGSRGSNGYYERVT